MTLERCDLSEELPLAWAQKAQLARQLPSVYSMRYAVVGLVASLTSLSPSTAAVPMLTLTLPGKLDPGGREHPASSDSADQRILT